MTTDPKHAASPGYALGRLQRAVETAADHPDAETRRRATAKIVQWRSVLQGMSDGTLSVGSRTPVADTRAWVTLEVAHGGIATGRYLAEGPLLDRERARLQDLPDDVRGSTDRERLNHWYLSDAGQAELLDALREGRLQVSVPEEGALPVVAWLLEHGDSVSALELVTELQPLMHRLRFYPALRHVPRPAGAMVRLRTVGEVQTSLAAVRPQRRVQAMNESLGVWAPLYDRLVALWLRTVEGEEPRLVRDESGELVRGPNEEPLIEGGWPCRRWPTDWATLRQAWLDDYRIAAARHSRCDQHTNPKRGFARLRELLERCPEDSRDLGGRDVARLRSTLAGTITRHGVPGSVQRQTLRAEQAAIVARPSFVELAAIVVDRLASEPTDGGLLTLEPMLAPATEGERAHVPAGTPMPRHFGTKVRRALEAPIDELVELGVIRSAEVLAIVLPQITSQVAAAGIEAPDLRELFGQIYAAFRRRRSLLLLHLEHQVRIDELPWVAALAAQRQATPSAQTQARQTLEQVTLLALSSFPQTILPNPLVREMGALARQANLELPLVEEIAADIFMGTFTAKWALAAFVAATALEGTLYARYYDLPSPAQAARWKTFARTESRWGRDTARGFAEACRERAQETVTDESKSRGVAMSGAVLEQSQILTTHDLAVLVEGLGLQGALRSLAPRLATRCFEWIVRRQQRHAPRFKARLQMVKNTAYAWRQALYFLSLCDAETQWRVAAGLEELVARQPEAWAQGFGGIVRGLRMTLAGGGFGADGRGREDVGARRFLGWSVGPHWLLG